MASNSVVTGSSRLIAAERGRLLSGYDLLGVERANQAHLKQLNAQLGSFAFQVAGSMAQLFNTADCELSYVEFTTASPVEVVESIIWVEARAAVNADKVAYFSISSAVIYRLAVLFFGGNLLAEGGTVPQNRALSDTEQRLLLRLCQYQIDIWSFCSGQGDQKWQLSIISKESVPAHSLCCAEAKLQAGGHQHSWHFWLLPPADAVARIGRALPAGELAKLLTHVPVRLRIVMGQLPMTLADLESLQVGDVLSLDLPQMVPAMVGNRPCFNGSIAEHKGGLVYQVATVVEE